MFDYQAVMIAFFGVSTVHAAYKGVNQARERRRVAERDLRWRQSELAQAMLVAMEEDELAEAAMLMLDWDGRPIKRDGERTVIRQRKVDDALRIVDADKFTEQEMWIRDCYDHLFYHFERLEQSLRVGLISPYDLLFPVHYLTQRMLRRRNVFEAFLTAYGYSGSIELLQRFENWGGDLTMASRPPRPHARTKLQVVRDFLLDIDPLKAPDAKDLAPKHPASPTSGG